MSTKIRLARFGAKKRPFYRIVVADSRCPRDGRYIEKIGTFNPLLPRDDAERVKFDVDRAKYWLSHGALARTSLPRGSKPSASISVTPGCGHSPRWADRRRRLPPRSALVPMRYSSWS